MKDNYKSGGAMSKYEKIGLQIGKIVDEKQAKYGDSFNRSKEVIKSLYPEGIKVEQYDNALFLIRVIDKLFRIATDNAKDEENPARDIAGYAILKSVEPK